MGLVIQVNGEEVFQQDEVVPMIHVLTPTGESSTIRCQSDFDGDYVVNLALDAAQGGVYLSDVEQKEREELAETLEGQEVAGTNPNYVGLSQEQIDEKVKAEQEAMDNTQKAKEESGEVPSETETPEGTSSEDKTNDKTNLDTGKDAKKK
jgi:hypothetical protein